MDNKEKPLDIYLMGIGGTGMGAFAGLLQKKGHRVSGSDSAVYSPMKEKLADWGISYKTPYHAENLPAFSDLVIIGNVIRKDNPEATAVRERGFFFDSFPAALNKLFLKDSVPIVASGTHGKTTCSALLAHTLFSAGCDPGFLIGGIPCNFLESFRIASTLKAPFVVEGDEYDTAYFDKRPKFIHYDPQYLLITSLEFDHGDIYQDLEAVIEAFASLLKHRTSSDLIVIHGEDNNIKRAINQAASKARIVTYGFGCDYQAIGTEFGETGIQFEVAFKGQNQGPIFIPLFGNHNVKNALGCYGILHQFGLSHRQISDGFRTFLGVKRRLEERFNRNGLVFVDDFAHHPSAVRETIRAAKQRYPHQKICAVFEPRSATSCLKVFQQAYAQAFLEADHVLLAPVGRNLSEEQRIDTGEIAKSLNENGINAKAFSNYDDLRGALGAFKSGVLLFMSNGDFKGMLLDVEKLAS